MSSLGLLVGAAVGALAVLGLPSISVRLVARLSVVLSAGALLLGGTLALALMGRRHGRGEKLAVCASKSPRPKLGS